MFGDLSFFQVKFFASTCISLIKPFFYDGRVVNEGEMDEDLEVRWRRVAWCMAKQGRTGVWWWRLRLE